MRDKNRIYPFCNELAEVWNKVPDWRFGQLMSNFVSWHYQLYGDPFFTEDNVLSKRLKEFIGDE